MSQYQNFQQIVHDQERRRNQLGRLQALGVALTTVTGTVTVAGVGEIQRQVAFAVNFTEQPTLTFGAEMLDNRYVGGQMPSLRAVVLGWHRRDFGTGREYVFGAALGIVANGVGDQTLALHWAAIGKAFRNPIESTVEVL